MIYWKSKYSLSQSSFIIVTQENVVVTIRTTSLTFNNSTFWSHSVFMCFVWIWEQTAIISLYNNNWLVCIADTACVYCAVRTGSLKFRSILIAEVPVRCPVRFVVDKMALGQVCLAVLRLSRQCHYTSYPYSSSCCSHQKPGNFPQSSAFSETRERWIERYLWSVTSLTFRYRASCILGQAFHYSPENAFYIFNQQIYFIIWYLLDRASLI